MPDSRPTREGRAIEVVSELASSALSGFSLRSERFAVQRPDNFRASMCEKCGHVQAEPNWCHRCQHRVTFPEWAAKLDDERRRERDDYERQIEELTELLPSPSSGERT